MPLHTLKLKGDIPGTIAGMRMFCTLPCGAPGNLHSECKIQRAACQTLADLAFEHLHSAKIADEGGIESIVAAMRGHKPDRDVQLQALRALGNLAVHGNEVQDLIAGHGGIESVVEALRSHAGDSAVQLQGLRALGNLAYSHAANSVKIAAAGGIPAALQAMAAHV